METSAAVRPIPGSASDESLVASVRGGSEPAFEVLYDRHLRGILGFCRHCSGSAEEAEDAVQHTFMAAYRDLLASGSRSSCGRGSTRSPATAATRCCASAASRPSRPPTSRRPSTSRAPSSAARTCATCSPTSPPCPTTSARRSCSPSSAPCPTTRSRPCSRAARQGQGARVPGPQLADRQPQGARHAVRGDPPPAREPARRHRAAHHPAPSPARVPRLPRVPARPARLVSERMSAPRPMRKDDALGVHLLAAQHLHRARRAPARAAAAAARGRSPR